MERRNFLKISALTGATAALDACGKPEQQLIRFIPEEELTPGVATWKPSLCPVCPAGCGLLVRVMDGDAEVIRNGRPGLIQMGLAKKLEGNPQHPVNQGKLCPRGQAAIQITYHPDRLRNPLKRAGARGSGEFQEITWEEAEQSLATQLAALTTANDGASLAFVGRPLSGQRQKLIEAFLGAFGAPPAVFYSPFDGAVERWANLMSFGHPQLPTVDLARTNYVLSFGADFLGTWNSPVAQAIGYGRMRQGRPGLRGKLVQVETRLSPTGANADEWIPCRPGTEGALALGLAHVILKENLSSVRGLPPGATLIDGWADGLSAYAPEEVEKKTGVPADRVVRLARELAGHPPALVLIGGAPLAHTNGAFAALAVNALNALLGALESEGGISFMPPAGNLAPASPGATPTGGYAQMAALLEQVRVGMRAPKLLLLYEANPVFSMPGDLHTRETLEKVPFIASFSSFLDETSVLADLILPDHSFLESWLDNIPESGTSRSAAGLAPPAMHPLHNTRAMPDVLLSVAHRLGGSLSDALPWKTYEEMLRAAFLTLKEPKRGSTQPESDDDFWTRVQNQGGWWSAQAQPAPPVKVSLPRSLASFAEPEFDGEPPDYPFHFLPFVSPQFQDGSIAHLPWMQEMPDVLSTVMWGSWVEINPATAAKLSIEQGDVVEVASQHGVVRAPALLTPGIAPDTVAMPIGQGHTNFGRYASGRGANPIPILAPKTEPQTGSLAWAATRVKLSRVGPGQLAMFAGGMSRFPHERESR